MAGEDIAAEIGEKSKEIKELLKDLKATLETWKFSVEETKEGMRVELHAIALIKSKTK